MSKEGPAIDVGTVESRFAPCKPAVSLILIHNPNPHPNRNADCEPLILA